MINHLISASVLFLLIQPAFCEPFKGEVKSRKIEEALSEIVAQAKIPGMIAAISSSNGILASGISGIRKIGTNENLTIQDLTHLGSCTKPMTSVLIGTLVSEGKLSWETRLVEAIPELKDNIHRDYHTINIWEMLTHRAGLEANAENWWGHGKVELKKRRLLIVQENLKKTSHITRGSYHYSNLGYLIASCIAEKVMDSTWESLMQKRVFEPLEMKSAGFGPPGTLGKTDQPWGHSRSGKVWQPRQFDNAPALGPAGRVHCTIADWAKFIAIQLPKGKKIGLKRATLDKLITPTGTYAGGWIVTERPWGNGVVLTHTGSNTMWYAVVWVAPKIDRAFLVVTNSRDEKSHAVCDQMIGKLIKINQEN
jgi:CubicO group peptidase (beta-lactamase class C family)